MESAFFPKKENDILTLALNFHGPALLWATDLLKQRISFIIVPIFTHEFPLPSSIDI